MDVLHQFELGLILFLQSLGMWFAEPMRLVTMLGSEEFFMLVMPSIFWSFNAALGFRVGLILILSNGLSVTLKLAFHSPRPYWLNRAVVGYVPEHSFGLPSTHAMSAMSIWGLIASSRRKMWERVALVAIIFLIGFSRIYLGVHFISDVLVGWLAGGLLLYIFLKVERPIVAWVHGLSLAQMIGLALGSAILVALLTILPAAALSDWQTPAVWSENAIASQPEGYIEPLNLDGAFTLSGTWFGFLAGTAWMFHRKGFFDASGTPRQRLLRYVIGVVGIFALWNGLGQVFPRGADLGSYALRFFRYTLVGLWISALAPLLFERLGLTR